MSVHIINFIIFANMPKQTNKSLKTIEREDKFQSIEREKLVRLESKLLTRNARVEVRLNGELKKKFISQVIRQGYKEVELAREIFEYYYKNQNRY